MNTVKVTTATHQHMSIVIVSILEATFSIQFNAPLCNVTDFCTYSNNWIRVLFEYTTYFHKGNSAFRFLLSILPDTGMFAVLWFWLCFFFPNPFKINSFFFFHCLVALIIRTTVTFSFGCVLSRVNIWMHISTPFPLWEQALWMCPQALCLLTESIKSQGG